MKKGVKQYTNFEVNEFGTMARNIDTGEVVQVTLNARYPTFNFSNTTVTAHQLVGHSWLAESYQDGLEIDHLRDVTDNHYTSLEWVTHAENCKRAAARRKEAGITRDKGGVMNYEIFIDLLHTKIQYDYSHSEMRDYIGYKYNQWFNVSYFPNVLNKVSSLRLWEHLKNDTQNSHLYFVFKK